VAVQGPELGAVHLLLTYKCIYECDHCFVWSGPQASGTMTTDQVERILHQAKEVPTVERVYFEGGEPFLYYPALVECVRKARDLGFSVGIVSNAYWATDKQDSALWLSDMARLGVDDLTLSTDTYHGTKEEAERVRTAAAVAKSLKIPTGQIEIRDIGVYSCESAAKDKLGDLFFRGRAAEKLAPKARKKPWKSLTSCPEEPPKISRVHVDTYGNVMFCQGISIGNLWKRPLRSIMRGLRVAEHPIIGPLVEGGPAGLCKSIGFRPSRRGYADGCHLCYKARCAARGQHALKDILCPDECYGVFPSSDQ